MLSRGRNVFAVDQSPAIGSSLPSSVIFDGWLRAIGDTQPTGKCETADESEESPVLATVDSSFWSDSDIQALRTQEIPSTPQNSEVGEELSESQLSLVVSVLPAFFGCPLPPSCFTWVDSADPAPPPNGDGDDSDGDGGDGAAEPGLCGVGVELQLLAPAAAGAEWVVAAVRPGGPADASGAVRCGDRIVSVNGYPIQGRSELYVSLLLMGRPGTAAILEVLPAPRPPPSPPATTTPPAADSHSAGGVAGHAAPARPYFTSLVRAHAAPPSRLGVPTESESGSPPASPPPAGGRPGGVGRRAGGGRLCSGGGGALAALCCGLGRD